MLMICLREHLLERECPIPGEHSVAEDFKAQNKRSWVLLKAVNETIDR
jgi:hypothetical protein